MRKIYVKSLFVIARSTNFSEMKYPDGHEFDSSDEDVENQKMYSNLRADSALIQLLKNLEDRDKIILIYQVLREAGYNLNHTDCADTLHITREHYMRLLRELKQRAGKISLNTLNE